jgi:hypothetical protein
VTHHPTSQAERLGLGFIAASVAAVLFYGLLRVVQARLFTEPNPATVVWSAHAGYFWRCLTVSYAGLMAGFLAYGAAGTQREAVEAWLLRALYAATAVILVQGLFVP